MKPLLDTPVRLTWLLVGIWSYIIFDRNSALIYRIYFNIILWSCCFKRCTHKLSEYFLRNFQVKGFTLFGGFHCVLIPFLLERKASYVGKINFLTEKIVRLQNITWWSKLYLHYLSIFNDEPYMDSQKDLESC